MDNKALVKYFLEVVSDDHPDEFDDYVAAGCTLRAGEQVLPLGADGLKLHMLSVKQTYPDLKITVTRQYCEGNTVISEFTATATHLGEWLGMKPTGKKLTFNGIDIHQVENGKITQHSGAMNTFETLFEAGAIQPV